MLCFCIHISYLVCWISLAFYADLDGCRGFPFASGMNKASEIFSPVFFKLFYLLAFL
jgi:hypothetical protein